MTAEEFGDFDADDAWAEEPADPEQTAKYLHELREYLSACAGDELAAWDALSPQDQEIGTALAQRLLDTIANSPDSAPQDLHAAISFFEAQPEWDDLSPDAQEVGVALLDDVLAWGTRQGSM